MISRANEPQSIGGILDSGVSLFTASFKQVVPLTYLGSLVSGLSGWFLQTLLFRQVNQGVSPEFNIWQVLIVYAAIIVFTTLFMAAAIVSIRGAYDGRKVSVGDALRGGVSRFPAMFGVSIIFGLALLAGLVLLIVPGIYISIVFAFGFYAAAADNKSAIESLKYSQKLVKGHWWMTAGVLTIITIIGMVFYFAAGFIAGLLAVAQAAASSLGPNFLTDVVIVPLVTGVVSAMMYCLGFALYEDLKLRSEGTDLADRIDSLD